MRFLTVFGGFSLGLLFLLTLGAGTARAGLSPEITEKHSGKPLRVFVGETIDGERIESTSLRGRTLVVNFFASWCPPCQEVLVHLRALASAYRERGVVFLGVLVDPDETPETIADARSGLAANPLPYPVLLINPSLREAFFYEGWPATYFVTGDGTFTTTLLGSHPRDPFTTVLDQVSPPSEAGAPRPAPSGSDPFADRPLAPLFPRSWEQWHPLLVHFPIAILVLETLFLVLHRIRPRTEFAHFSRWLLWLAGASLLGALYTGFSDAGVGLGEGWSFWNGLRDRIRNLILLRSAVSLHVLYALGVALATASRLAWRFRAGDAVIRGRRGWLFLAFAFLGLWLLFAAGQVGGGITHR